MKTLRTLKISPNAPDINSVWLYKGTMRYFNNGMWEAIAGNVPVPTHLPNPATLTFTGAVSDTYNGSESKTVNIPTYDIKQVIQQTAVNLPSGTPTAIIRTVVNKAGTYEVDFITAINAIPSVVLAELTSEAVFASCTLTVSVNSTAQFSSIVQVGRAGTSPNNINTVTLKSILTLAENDIVSVTITSNDTGLSIPSNGNTRLILKG